MTENTVRLTEAMLHSPHDNLCAAISIVQSHILASDSMLIPDRLFGGYYMQTPSLEAAVSLLVPLLGETEDIRWHFDSSNAPGAKVPAASTDKDT